MISYIVSRHTAQLGFSYTNSPEVNIAPSETVPGMTLSLETLLQKYVRGESVPLFPPADPGTTDEDLLLHMSNLSRLSELDKIDALRELSSTIDATRTRLEAANAARASARAEAEKASIKAMRDEAAKAKPEAPPPPDSTK